MRQPGIHTGTRCCEVHQSGAMSPDRIIIAGSAQSIDAAMARLVAYPRKTPLIYDYPGPGEPDQITTAEIKRTRQIRSRISRAEEDYFTRSAETAPWLPMDSDLGSANPAGGGLFERMSSLYSHFADEAPKGISIGKISKVLHLKRPQSFPIVDSRVREAYRAEVRASRRGHPHLGRRRRAWVVIREDLLTARSSGVLNRLRERLVDFTDEDEGTQSRVRRLNEVTDLRLLDMLTWAPSHTAV